MTSHRFLLPCAVALVVTAFAACSSSGKNNMSPEDKTVWLNAREQHGVGVLDDKRFHVELVPSGDIKGDPDTLEFAGGRFHSKAGDPNGFGSGEYTTIKVDGGIGFHATCRNSIGGTNAWHGTIRGDAIEGGYSWTQPNSPPMAGNFHGNILH